MQDSMQKKVIIIYNKVLWKNFFHNLRFVTYVRDSLLRQPVLVLYDTTTFPINLFRNCSFLCFFFFFYFYDKFPPSCPEEEESSSVILRLISRSLKLSTPPFVYRSDWLFYWLRLSTPQTSLVEYKFLWEFSFIHIFYLSCSTSFFSICNNILWKHVEYSMERITKRYRY